MNFLRRRTRCSRVPVDFSLKLVMEKRRNLLLVLPSGLVFVATICECIRLISKLNAQGISNALSKSAFSSDCCLSTVGAAAAVAAVSFASCS